MLLKGILGCHGSLPQKPDFFIFNSTQANFQVCLQMYMGEMHQLNQDTVLRKKVLLQWSVNVYVMKTLRLKVSYRDILSPFSRFISYLTSAQPTIQWGWIWELGWSVLLRKQCSLLICVQHNYALEGDTCMFVMVAYPRNHTLSFSIPHRWTFKYVLRCTW